MLGQAGLVMSERFVQFSGLVDNCQYKQGEKETTCQDLRGFWEMIYFQVTVPMSDDFHSCLCFRLKMSIGNLSS